MVRATGGLVTLAPGTAEQTKLEHLRRAHLDRSINGVRPRQQRAIETRERILTAATGVMAEVGRDRLTICEVVKRAGVAAGTFYRYFPDRAVLIEAVLARDPVHQAQLEILNDAVLIATTVGTDGCPPALTAAARRLVQAAADTAPTLESARLRAAAP
ncbi:TetR/AcrR family transcriptional regulator [Rathayibacter rathayi]|uniref:TetR/AcrR family transcriptional regulator n=1 Tax=Rathayibacter rathayi TaxID=33887 RepID=UPI000CE7EF7B|nr:helix-turn-helix domain-containing protein [Rathayibacter rathayi]PPI76928.1 hypothetical protein C5E03_07680 [Rathayibacter rathayi]